MNRKAVSLLMFLTGVMAIVLVMTTHRLTPNETHSDPQGLTVPELSNQLHLVNHVRITHGGEPAEINLVQKDGQWIVHEKNAFPASVTQINQLLIGLSKSQKIEAKTAKPELYEKLGVQEPTESGGVKLELLAADSSTIAAIYLGETRYGANAGTYIRTVGDKQSWLVSGELTASTDIMSWLDDELTNFSATLLKSVHVRPHKGTPLIIRKSAQDDEQFTIQDLPDSAKLLTPDGHSSVANGLRYLRLSDVATKESQTIDASTKTSIKYAFFDGLVIEANLYKGEDQFFWTEFDVSVDEAQAEHFKTNAAEQQSSSPIMLKERLEKKFAGWIFQIPAYKANSMAKSLDDLLKKEVEKEKSS